jgi:hypothetical protein
MEANDNIGYCICLYCNTRIPHTEGQPCRDNDCPQCGKKLIREGSYHHQLYLSKKGEVNQYPPEFKSCK